MQRTCERFIVGAAGAALILGTADDGAKALILSLRGLNDLGRSVDDAASKARIYNL
ncbi:MAG: hypothetical protein KDA63_10510 [Planctomycetales bacterium]|nr:hypothetical protein [Planctomycetales bacterium]